MISLISHDSRARSNSGRKIYPDLSLQPLISCIYSHRAFTKLNKAWLMRPTCTVTGHLARLRPTWWLPISWCKNVQTISSKDFEFSKLEEPTYSCFCHGEPERKTVNVDRSSAGYHFPLPQSSFLQLDVWKWLVPPKICQWFWRIQA